MTLEELQAKLDASPYYSKFGLSISTQIDDSILLKLPSSVSLIGNPAIKAIHGGIVAMALELVANLQANFKLNQKHHPLSQTTSFLRRTNDTPLFASAKVIKSGRLFVTAEASAWQEDCRKPVATAMFTFQI